MNFLVGRTDTVDLFIDTQWGTVKIMECMFHKHSKLTMQSITLPTLVLNEYKAKNSTFISEYGNIYNSTPVIHHNIMKISLTIQNRTQSQWFIYISVCYTVSFLHKTVRDLLTTPNYCSSIMWQWRNSNLNHEAYTTSEAKRPALCQAEMWR